MIEGETDISNYSLDLHQAANDSILTKILCIIYGMKGNDVFLCTKSFKNSCSFKCLDISSLHYISLDITSFNLSSLQMSCQVK